MSAVEIEGTCAPRLGAVKDAFRDNFVDDDELGAAACVIIDGETVLDLWGGWRTPARQQRWDRDTIVVSLSASKAPEYLVVMKLVHEGVLDLDAPVATWWPEFAAAGKGHVLLHQVLNHTSGLPVVDAPPGSGFDWDFMVRAVAAAPLRDPPGTHSSYHSLIQQWVLGEVIRRVTGRDFVEVFRQDVARPLDVDFQFGLDDAAIARCADYLFRPPPDSYYLRPPEPGSVATLALQPLGEERDFNSERMRRAVLPAVNGHTNGRSLARLFAPLALGGTWNGVTLADQALIERFRSLQWEGDADLGYVHFRMGLGLLLGDPGRDTDFGPNPRAFGCPGTGGILGMADPEARLSYGYSPNNGSPAKGLGPRNRRLITALYRCL